jgi:hypothetical protein
MAGRPYGSGGGWLGGSIVFVSFFLVQSSFAAAAPVVETRDFTVFVDGKAGGDAHMTINKQDDGSLIMTCDTDINVRISIGILWHDYVYSLRAREVWKDGRVQRFDSTCNDDGKRFAVTAVAEADKLRLRVNGEEKTASADVWISSYWAMPDRARINQSVAIIDADTGATLSAKVLFLGVETRRVAGQEQKVNHFRLTGKVPIDLWYDTTGRLVAEDWIEDGHRTQVELNRLRR